MKKLRQLGAVDVSNMAITGRHVVTQFHSVHLSRVVQQHLKNESTKHRSTTFVHLHSIQRRSPTVCHRVSYAIDGTEQT